MSEFVFSRFPGHTCYTVTVYSLLFYTDRPFVRDYEPYETFNNRGSEFPVLRYRR